MGRVYDLKNGVSKKKQPIKSAWRFIEVVVVKAAKKQYVSRPVMVT
jgi:hypothetical protein